MVKAPLPGGQVVDLHAGVGVTDDARDAAVNVSANLKCVKMEQHVFAFSLAIEGTTEKVLQFIMPLHYAEHRYVEHRYAEYRYAEHHYAEHRYADHPYDEHHYAEHRYAEHHYAECQAECYYAECHYADCHGTNET